MLFLEITTAICLMKSSRSKSKCFFFFKRSSWYQFDWYVRPTFVDLKCKCQMNFCPISFSSLESLASFH